MQDNGLKELAAYEHGGESRQLIKLNTGDKIHVGGIYLDRSLDVVYIKRFVPGKMSLYEANTKDRYPESGHWAGTNRTSKWDLVYEIRGEFAKELLAAGLFED